MPLIEEPGRGTLIADLRERAAFYLDRPSVPTGEYPASREISWSEAKATADLPRRAADALSAAV